MDINRRDFIKLVGLGSAVFVLGSKIQSEAAAAVTKTCMGKS